MLQTQHQQISEGYFQGKNNKALRHLRHKEKEVTRKLNTLCLGTLCLIFAKGKAGPAAQLEKADRLIA